RAVDVPTGERDANPGKGGRGFDADKVTSFELRACCSLAGGSLGNVASRAHFKPEARSPYLESLNAGDHGKTNGRHRAWRRGAGDRRRGRSLRRQADGAAGAEAERAGATARP